MTLRSLGIIRPKDVPTIEVIHRAKFHHDVLDRAIGHVNISPGIRRLDSEVDRSYLGLF